ncbi:heme exporter protein CcmD [Gallaecimonas xiamenensis]|uniref:Heme exporter protein D n=1 Tax=Gallaecimonas xiamenensis 3-C-1 TaxID=745411 RepID=K2JLT7_9GAMM|nr:heme exporter protein CcmD [Gallaecimonas xiamenensis]EKE75387.1 CcmD protein [Gallaecimonas xiamenensis 3-C-1]
MYFDSFEAFLAQGKHGFFVWLAYGVTLLVLLLLAWGLWQAERSLVKEVQRRHAREVRRQTRMAEEAVRESKT